jgi:hypothetical protein
MPLDAGYLLACVIAFLPRTEAPLTLCASTIEESSSGFTPRFFRVAPNRLF